MTEILRALCSTALFVLAMLMAAAWWPILREGPRGIEKERNAWTARKARRP